MSCASWIVTFITVPTVFLIGLTALSGVQKGNMSPSNVALALIVPVGLLVFFAVTVKSVVAATNRDAEKNFKNLLRESGVSEGSLEWRVMVEDYEQKHQQ
jgi:hypothetical protein